MLRNTIVYRGIPASYGKFYGKVLKIISSNHIIINIPIPAKSVTNEIQRFLKAIKSTKKQLENSIKKKSEKIDKDIVDILTSQIYMLDDPILVDGVITRITNFQENSAYALFKVIEDITQRFNQINDDYFRERAVDIKDIGKRIEDNILGRDSDYYVLSKLEEEVVIVAHEITPSQMIHLDKTHVRGIATETGGKTGHMAILAKNYSIPTVVGLKKVMSDIDDDEFVLIDADEGILVKNPGINQIKYYGASTPYPRNEFADYSAAITLDGVKIRLKANLDSEADSSILYNSAPDGVGLFRSETILIESPEIIHDEETQFHIYKRIAESLKEKSLTIRTFDLGGDKWATDKEDNPFLGNRGIRYTLRNPDWFKKQIRAIYRASNYGNLSIMIPMVSALSEVIETRKLIEECKSELSKKRVKFSNVKFGIMVETPASAISLDLFAKTCDFFSVGTNDLLQYMMAVDRNNHVVSDLYNPYNLSFLRIMKSIVDVSAKYDIPLGICGELASDTKFTILLIGIGFRELSISMPLVKKVKKLILSMDLKHSEKLVEKIFKLSEEERYGEIDAFLFNKHMD